MEILKNSKKKNMEKLKTHNFGSLLHFQPLFSKISEIFRKFSKKGPKTFFGAFGDENHMEKLQFCRNFHGKLKFYPPPHPFSMSDIYIYVRDAASPISQCLLRALGPSA